MIAAVILAGGRARRLGGVDKALLTLAPGRTILDELLARLRPQADAIALSANGDPARFARFGLPVLPDASVDQGPLAGILAGMLWAGALGAEALLTVAGDTPFIPSDLAARLSPGPSFAAAGGRAHPLTALWLPDQAAVLRRHLEGDASRSVQRFAQGGRAREVALPAAEPFFNINTSADLAAARAFSA